MSLRLKLKVVPGASRTEIVGWLGDALKVRVAAPPEKGKANRAVVEALAAVLEISTSDIEIVGGAGTANKLVEIRGVAEPRLRELLR